MWRSRIAQASRLLMTPFRRSAPTRWASMQSPNVSGGSTGNPGSAGVNQTTPSRTWMWAAAAAAAGGLGYYYYRNRKNPMPEPTSKDVPVVPGHDPTMKTKMLESGAMIMQNFDPLKGIHQHVCGAHFYNGDINRQVIAHHYCSHVNEDMMQCVIFDSDEKHAKLIGIEYIITQRLFDTLPAEEQALWHSHVHEVKGGLLVAPRLPEVAETEVMKKLVKTYGKTWHMWQVDRGDVLPLGPPQLMMAFTKDGQIKDDIRKLTHQPYGVDMEHKKKIRAGIDEGNPSQKADAWQHGNAMQVQLRNVSKL